MTLAYLQRYVGCPHAGAASTWYWGTAGEIETWGWPGAMQGHSGWWCAITLGDVVLEVSWTIGGANQRNVELRGMVARHQPAQVSA